MEEKQQAIINQPDNIGYYRYMSDAACKEFLSDKLILACILKGCTEEFKDCDVHDIETKYIEGEPEIGSIGVHPETINEHKLTARLVRQLPSCHRPIEPCCLHGLMAR